MAPSVVVGTDGSAASARAVDWAASAAHHLGAHLTIVLVVPQAEWWRLPDRDSVTLRRTRNTIGARHPALVVETRLVAGDTVVRLLEAAASAQLLVVGTDRDGAGGAKPSFGTVPERIAVAARCPVAVIPVNAGGDENAGARVLAALDDDAHAAAVLAAANDVAAWAGAHPGIVHVWKPDGTGRGTTGLGATGLGGAASETLLTRMSAIIASVLGGEADVPADPPNVELLVGGAATELAAAAVGATLLVLGTSGRSTPSTRVLGAVCMALVSSPPCALLIVPGISIHRLVPIAPLA